MMLLLAVALAGAIRAPTAACPATPAPAAAFVPMPPYPERPPDGWFWYGTPQLWTQLPRGGTAILRDKSFWWSPEYARTREPRPDLRVTATSLDTGFLAFMEPATNASSPDMGGLTMLTMLVFPTPGCWRVTATYGEASVSYVTRVSP